MAINWDDTFALPVPAVGEDFDTATLFIQAPTYGNYGGRGYTNGIFTDDAIPLPANTYDPATAVDALDLQFLAHDQAIEVAETAKDTDLVTGQSLEAAADLALVNDIVALTPEQLDAEASLYAGLATAAFLVKLESNPVGVDPTEEEVLLAQADASDNIERGVAGLDLADQVDLAEWLDDVSDVPEVQAILSDYLLI
jgi:hypothetical protein